MKKGKLIVIVAPSGTGKSTLIERLKSDFPMLSWSVSCTTRNMRPGEVNGVNYHFITKEDFEHRIKKDEFVEWALVHSNYYGTSKAFVQAGLDQGLHLLFDIDVQGADNIKKAFGHNAHVIFIEPPSVDELKARLLKRATDPLHIIEERVNNAVKELERKGDFDHLVMNDDMDLAYKKLHTIFTKIIGN
ncbi:MAG: guanylate kinase [Bacteriovoracaceae bacterium]